MSNNLLNDYGFKEYCLEMEPPEIPDGLSPARVVAQHKSQYRIITGQGECAADLSGKYRYALDEKGGYPAVGDYIMAQVAETGDFAAIHGLLPRRSLFCRTDGWNASGYQNVAANFNTVLICMSLNKDFNIARLERYMIMARESGAGIAVVLTKADLYDGDVEMQTMICQAVAGDAPVYAVSAADGRGMQQLNQYFAPGRTVVALGSSGVGKSTLVNALYGQEIMAVAAIREDDARGRHTTVHRQIILLPDGGLYMDTPGMRELGLVSADDSVAEVFGDIEGLAESCRFDDCSHKHEPGCAVLAALEHGELEEKRYRRYLKYLGEMSYAADPQMHKLQKTKFFKQIHKATSGNPGRNRVKKV